MLIHGGMTSSGRFATFGVVGSYWMSCSRSFWKTTLPGRGRDVDAELEGLRVGHRDLELAVAAPRCRRGRLLRPLTRFCPPVAIVSRNTSGLVSAKFDGASASMYCRVKKSTFRFVASSRPSTLPTASCSQSAAIEVALLDVVEQEMLLPVLVPEALVALARLATGPGRRPSA